MMPAANRGIGGDLAFPDVCKTPMGLAPIPLPYPNLGLNVLAVPFSPNVFWSYVPALTMTSMIASTMLNEAGVLGGVISQIIKGPGFTTMGNPIVFVNFQPAKNLLCPTSGNAFNAMGACLIPSLTNVLLTYQPASCQGAFVERPGATTAVSSADPPGPPRADDEPRLPTVDRAGLAQLRAVVAPPPDQAAPPVRARLLDAGVGYLKLAAFPSTITTMVFNALRELGLEQLQALVVDLRACPGGDGRAALDLADDFLPPGTALAVVHELDGDETILVARGDEPYPWPLAILVDGDTASAAELFAGCLQVHGRAVLVGERTRGKSTAQQVLPAAKGPPVYGTVAELRLPTGQPIHGVGLTPDAGRGAR